VNGRWAAIVILVLSSAAVIRASGIFSFAPSAIGAPPKTAPAVPVLAEKALRKDAQSFLTAPGAVKPINTATIRSRVDGLLLRVHFSEGQSVRAGELLAEVDPDSYEAALDLAEASLAKDEAQLGNARRDLGRYARLSDSGAVSGQQKDTTKALVAQLEAAVKADRAQIELARLQFNWCRITAPFDGRVGAKITDPGNVLRASEATGVVTINQMSPIFVEFPIPSDALPQLRQALQRGGVEILAEDMKGGMRAHGTLAMIDNQINAASATIKLKAQFDNADEALWPGLFVNVRIPYARFDDALTIPSIAVQRADAGDFVYVVGRDAIVEKRYVTSAALDKTTTVVTKGLAENELVVTDGHYRIEPGSRVEILPVAGGG